MYIKVIKNCDDGVSLNMADVDTSLKFGDTFKMGV